MAKSKLNVEPIKQSSIQLITYCNSVIEFFESNSYSNQIIGQDINSQNSPYIQNEENLDEVIDRIIQYCDVILNSKSKLDSISTHYKVKLNGSFGIIEQYKSNILSYWNQLHPIADQINEYLIMSGLKPFEILPNNIQIKNLKDSYNDAIKNKSIINEIIEKKNYLKIQLNLLKNLIKNK